MKQKKVILLGMNNKDARRAQADCLQYLSIHPLKDPRSHVPSAVARKMLLNKQLRNAEKEVPELFDLPHYHTLKG